MEHKTGLVDFHFHTNHSDGTATIAGAIAEAKLRGVVAMALTDHNTRAGVKEFLQAAREAGIRALEGTEIFIAFPRTEWSWDMTKCGPVPDATILGRELNWQKFEDYRKNLEDYRIQTWVPESLEKMRAIGLKVPYLTKEEIKQQVANGEPIIFDQVPKDPENWPQLLKICQGYDPAYSMEELQKSPRASANRYVYSIQGGAYVLRGLQEFGVGEAVDLAEQMGGALFVAHPGGNYANWSVEHLDYFVYMGGHGIEVWQYYHKPDQIRLFLEYAIRYDLLVSGGSDWHEKNSRTTMGCWDKPENQTPNWVARHLLDRLP